MSSKEAQRHLIATLEKELAVLQRKAKKAAESTQAILDAPTQLIGIHKKASEIARTADFKKNSEQVLEQIQDLADQEKRLLRLMKKSVSKAYDHQFNAEHLASDFSSELARIKFSLRF